MGPSPEHPICICLLSTLGPGTAASTGLLPQKSLHKRAVARRTPPPPTIIRFLPSGLGIKRSLSPHLPGAHFTARPREARLPSAGRGGTPRRRGGSPTCVGRDSDSEARLPLTDPQTETDKRVQTRPQDQVPARQSGKEAGLQQAAAASPPAHSLDREGPAPSRAGRGGGSRPAPGSPSRLPDRQTPPRWRWGHAGGLGRHSQLLVEPGLAAGLEVADDDAELPDVLHELLQVLLQVVELLSHGPAVRTAAGTLLPRRLWLPPGPATTSVSSGAGWAGPGRWGGAGHRGVAWTLRRCLGRGLDRGRGLSVGRGGRQLRLAPATLSGPGERSTPGVGAQDSHACSEGHKEPAMGTCGIPLCLHWP